jgi:hypothetical protein
MEYRWLTNDEIETWVNPVCVQNGWAQMNINEQQPTCQVRGAFDGVKLVSFLAWHFFPVIGPAYVDPDYRDGSVTRELADQMHEHLVEMRARGALALCENAVAERISQRHGMKLVNYPVYLWVGSE